MTKWTLVIPKNQTPRLKSGRYSDQKWFEEDLASLAPGVELEWLGRDWLDIQASEHLDFQKYVEGPNAQVLQRAKEYRMESEVMANGSLDLYQRNATLRRRCDEISMYWRLSYLVTRDTQVFSLEEKYPGAAEDDPITLIPTFSFESADESATNVRSQLERTLNFGGRVEVPSQYLASFDVEASDEARLLLAMDRSATASLAIESVTVPLEPPVPGNLSYIEPDDTEVASLPIYFRRRTAGARGMTLFGGDADGLLALEVVLPTPSADHVSGSVLPDAAVQIDVSAVDGFGLDAVTRLARFLAAATAGRRLCLELSHGRMLVGQAVGELQFPGGQRLLDVTEALLRLQQHVGQRLWFPRGMTVHQADMLIVAARLLAGEQVPIEAEEWTVSIKPHGVESVLKLLSRERFQLLCTTPEAVLVAGDLEIPYGPMTQWGPELSLMNPEELKGYAGRGPVSARLATNGRPVCWLPYDRAVEIAQARVPTA